MSFYPGTLFQSALEKYARLLVDYSVSVSEGDRVAVMGPVEALPVIREVYKRALEKGAHPYIFLSDTVSREVFYRYASGEQLSFVHPVERVLFEEYNVHVSFIASPHTKPMMSVDPGRIAAKSKAIKPLRSKFLEKAARGEAKWVVAPYPTLAMAQEADMSPIDYEEFVYRALKLYEEDPVKAWRKQAEKQERIVELLDKVDELRIVGPGVDLTVKVSGRKWISDDGHNNMPGGEVFTGPVEDSVEGCIRFDYPAVYMGRAVEGVKLCFRKGVVVEYDAVRGREMLEKLLAVDEGAKRLGEIAFGLNYDIDRATKDILFDEKIGGTMHLALGQSYPETGGRNESAIHWDMVKDLKSKDSKVYADGELVYEAGKFHAWED